MDQFGLITLEGKEWACMCLIRKCWILWQKKIRFRYMHVDGSWFGQPGPTRFGRLLRDSFGNCIRGFIGDIGVADNTKAEFLALLFGLHMAWRLIAVQSCTLLLGFNLCVGYRHRIGMFNSNILWGKEINVCADFRAKMGLNSGSALLELECPPNELKHHLLSDARRV